MKEPLRLCDGDELPSALRDAFRALEREAPSAEMVARVQHALQALPAATPGAVAVSALSTGKLLVLGTLLAGTVASLVALRNEPISRSATTPRRAPAVAESVEPSVAVPASRSADRVANPAQPSAARPEPAAAVAVMNASPRREREARAATRTEATAATRSITHTSSRPSKSGGAPRPAQVSAPESAVVPQEISSTATNEGAVAPSAPDPDAAGAQASEARMLAQAKRLAAREPVAALRQLETLSAQFPAGLFAQERELLAIQLHRQLGHAALADQLARQFQERYPRSLYRRTLPP